MKLIQFYQPGKGPRVGVVRADQVADLTHAEEGIRSTLDLLVQGKTLAGLVRRVEWLARSLHRRGGDWRELQRVASRRAPHLLVPLAAPEVWVARPDTANGSAPGIFFKATASRVAAPHAALTLRRASRDSRARAGLAVALSGDGEVLAVTAYLGLTAQDVPREDARAEMAAACCALGPCLLTADELEALPQLQMRLSVVRGGRPVFSEPFIVAPTGALAATLPALLEDNVCPVGTVLALESAPPVPGWPSLEDGDQVELEAQAIGRLVSAARRGQARGPRGEEVRLSVPD